MPYFTNVIELEKGNAQSYLDAQKKIGSVDLILCPHESVRSALFVRKIPAQIRVGFSQWWNFWIFSHRRSRLWKYPDAIRQLSLLTCLQPELQKEIESFAHYDANYLSGSRLKSVPASVDLQLPEPADRTKNSRKVAIFPGSVWATKKWTEEGFKNLGLLFEKNAYDVLWMGSKDEMELCERLQGQVPGSISTAGKLNLWQSVETLKTCGLVVSNDSGGQHMAALYGIPTVSIFGPTVLNLGYRPWNSKASVVENSYLSCRPCGKHGHKQCPIGTHECMTSITPQSVYEAGIKLL